MKDLTTDTINRLQTKAQSDAPMHQRDSAMIKQVESPQILPSGTRISSRRRRDVAQQ